MTCDNICDNIKTVKRADLAARRGEKRKDMKDAYIRFRCTEAQKALIEQMAKNDGSTMSEFIIGEMMARAKHFHEATFEVVVKRKGVEIGRKEIGTYLLDEYNRASGYTVYKELNEKALEYFRTFKQKPNDSYIIESNGKRVITNEMSSYMWLEHDEK